MVLIVDDRPENILPLQRILEMHGLETDSAVSGEEALRKVLLNTYSVIILDVQMPEMDGFEVAEAISGYSKARDTPILFLSAVNKDKKFIARGYSSGGIDYLTKPVDPDILLLKVRTFIRLFDQQKELKEVQANLRKEIESRKQAQEQLAEMNAELQFVLKSLPQIAFMITSAGEIQFVNKHWAAYSEQSDIFPEVHPDDQDIFRQFVSQLPNKEDFRSEMRIKKLDTGLFRYFLLNAIPIVKGAETVRWIGTLTDIQQQKSVNDELEETVKIRTKELLDKNEELETSNHELQQFAWVVSHDLKEPLRKIQTFNSLVRDKYVTENPEAISYLNRSINASSRMSQLITDLLDYSRLSIQSPFVTTNINDIILGILAEYSEVIEENNVQIHLGNIPPIDVIPSQIRQVFQNLISNALKFLRSDITPILSIDSEIVEELSASAIANPVGKFCRITIVDNGIGFNEKFLDRIFIIFQRLNNQKAYEGTGIGLAIAKKIVDKHNGLITAESRENEGSRFIVILPISQL